MALLRKLKRILAEEFPAPDTVWLEDHEGIFGSIRSERFKGLGGMARQDLIDKILTARLDAKELQKIQFIVGVTPLEGALMEAD